VTVITMSEFGRRVAENGAAGTDHGRAGAMLILGGGVVGGVHARWPGLDDADLDAGDLAVTTDFRDVLAEIVYQRLGNPRLDQTFPGYVPTLPGIVRPRAGLPPPVVRTGSRAYFPALHSLSRSASP
jgi:uncharacterized protein (DUF1501 family)